MTDVAEPQYEQLERAKRRRSARAFGLWLALWFAVFAVASRLGWLERFPWLSSEVPGPISPGWMVSRLVMVAVIGLLAGWFWFKVIRFPAPRDRSSPG